MSGTAIIIFIVILVFAALARSSDAHQRADDETTPVEPSRASMIPASRYQWDVSHPAHRDD